MDNDTAITDNDRTAETDLSPRAGECLVCYVHRQVGVFGCDDTHRFSELFREETAPRATALIPRLRGLGARQCDCELLREVYTFAPRPLLARGDYAGRVGALLDSDDLFDIGVLRKVKEYGPAGEYRREWVYEDISRFGNSRSERYRDLYAYGSWSDGPGVYEAREGRWDGLFGMDSWSGRGDLTIVHRDDCTCRCADAQSGAEGFGQRYPFPDPDSDMPWESGYGEGHDPVELLGDLSDHWGRSEVGELPEKIYLCCQYVRRGSTQPCGNWQRGKRRPRWTTPTGPGWGAESWNPEPPGWYSAPPEEPGVRAPF